MKSALWKFIDLSWFIAFEIFLAYAFNIFLIGMLFIPIILLFMKLFSTTITKFGSSWILWSVPYTISAVFFLSLFSGMNPLIFTFKTFWLSLATWFSQPISPFGMAAIFFAISYIVGYLTTHLIERTLNTFLALSVVAVIAGISTQYCCLPISLGFMILFITSFLLSLNVSKMRFSKALIALFAVTIVIVIAFFSIGMFSTTPFTPLKSVMPHHTSQSTTTASITSNEVHNFQSQKPPLHFSNAPSHGKIYLPTSKMENIIFNMIMYIVGISIIGMGIFFFIAFFKLKSPKRKMKWKKTIWAIWMMASAFFVITVLIYAFNIVGNSIKVPKADFQYQPNVLSLPTNLPSNLGNISAYLGKDASEGVKTGNPIILITLATIGLIIILYMILNFVKGVTPISNEEKTSNESPDLESYNENEEKIGSHSAPWQIVLFYYKMLRRKVGDPSSTPYEFEKDLISKLEDSNISRATDLFVKLRYAHRQITEEDAAFMKKWVESVIKKLK
jgi:hypothetical protein